MSIAVIDDNSAVLASLLFALKVCGFEAIGYPSSATYLAADHDPECLILDHNMPEMTGLELVSLLRRSGRNVPVLLTTGLLEPEVDRVAKNLGIECVAPKPTELAALLAFVRTYTAKDDRG